jgi:geranylgeranyl reductase family protein
LRVDVAVVGGGPAGCFVGEALAKRGFEVTIIEEHGEVGNPACCAGVVGVDGLRELKIKPGKWVLGKLRRAVFYPPSNEPIEISRGKVEAFVIDRAAFDRELARKAVTTGASLLLRSRCVGLKLGREPVVKLKGGRETEVEARLVIGADGPASTVAREASLLKTTHYLKCAQLETFAEVRADATELYFGSSFAPGFFAWLTPAGDICRVGLGTLQGDALEKLLSFIRTHPAASAKIQSSRILNLCAGLILEPLTRRIYADRVMLVGDAAGHVKPLTGGGIYVGLSCAQLAAEVAADALGSEPTAKKLRAYEQAVMKRFGRKFELGIRARRVFERMTDEDLDSIFELLKREDVQALVIKHFDFDHHEKLLRTLLIKAPRLFPSLELKGILKYSRYLLKP